MRRREFIAGFAAWSASAHAQSTARHYRIGVLDTSARQINPHFAVLQRGLGERGYVEGRNAAFEYRSADGHNESFAALAAELVRLDVDVIVTRGTLAAKAATATIPVVMAAAGDPVAIARGGARPAGNLTGFGAYVAGIEGRRVEILRDMLAKVERVAALMNLSNPSRRSEWSQIEASARTLRIAPQVLATRTAADTKR
jgi:putative tryptophan/tyrosine transport system substrate-binding protein